MEVWTQRVNVIPFGRHLLCTWPIAFILPWTSEKWNLFLKWTDVFFLSWDLSFLTLSLSLLKLNMLKPLSPFMKNNSFFFYQIYLKIIDIFLILYFHLIEFILCVHVENVYFLHIFHWWGFLFLSLLLRFLLGCTRLLQKFHLRCLMTKPTKLPLRPAKTQISLGICPVWSVFAVCFMGS